MRRILDSVQTRCGDFVEGQLSTAINRKELVGDLVKTWQEKASDRQTLCFAVDIAHSKAIVEDFRSEGIQAEHLDCLHPGNGTAQDHQAHSGIMRYKSCHRSMCWA